MKPVYKVVIAVVFLGLFAAGGILFYTGRLGLPTVSRAQVQKEPKEAEPLPKPEVMKPEVPKVSSIPGTPQLPPLPGYKYYNVGLGCGYAVGAPAVSPHDPNLMFFCGTKGTLFRSTDGGAYWRVVDFRNTRCVYGCQPVFHPVKNSVVYVCGKVSEDGGLTWRYLADPQPWGLYINVLRMGIDPATGRIILIGTGEGTFISRDEGKTWTKCEGIAGRVVGFVVDATSPENNRRVFAGTPDSIYRSDDDGQTWTGKTNGLPWTEIASFAGAADKEKSRLVLYCTVPSKKVDNAFGGGVFRSRDYGETWESVMKSGVNTELGQKDEWGGEIAQYEQVLCAEGFPDRVYVTCLGTGTYPPYHSTVYRSDNAGENWRYVLAYDQRVTDCNVEHGWKPMAWVHDGGGPPPDNGVCISQSNPDILMFTNDGEVYVTRDGGGKWLQCYTNLAPNQEKPYHTNFGRKVGFWYTNGSDSTTAWNYVIDPRLPNRHYICYGDVSFGISEDGGRTWTCNKATGRTPWPGSTYDLVVDKEVEGLAWAAMSNRHDIPHSPFMFSDVSKNAAGGVCISMDSCNTWEVTARTLPSAPCTSIAIDPSSPKYARVLYAAMFGLGVYKTQDGGHTWKSASNGLPLDVNPHVYLVRMHVDGTLFVSITGYREGSQTDKVKSKKWHRGGLFISRDGGENWTDITRSQEFYYPIGFAFHPQDSRIVYLATSNCHVNPDEGVLWKTTDGGNTWKHILKNSDLKGKGGPEPDQPEGYFISMHPEDLNTLYLGTSSHGLWYSHDAGETWKQLEDLPVGGVNRITVDPKAKVMYISTFGGGVYAGPVP